MKNFLKTFSLLLLSSLLWSLAHPSAPPLITKTSNYILDTGFQEVLAWFGLIPMLFALKGKSGKRLFFLAFLFSFFYFAISQYWINIAVVMFGDISYVISFTIFIALMIELALQWALGIYIAYTVHQKYSYKLSTTLPITFTVTELFRNYFVFSGYPWSNIAYSQYYNLPILQTASIWGVYGIVFMIVLCNVVLFEIYEYYKTENNFGFPKFASIFLILMLTLSFSYGTYRLHANDVAEENAKKLKAAMVQGNIEQDLKNQSFRHAYRIIDVYKDLTKQIPDSVDLVIWPEAAFPFNIPRETPHFKRTFTDLYDKLPWMFMTGVSTYTEDAERNHKYYNSAFLFDKDTNVIAKSDKSHLVPFGEYVPMRDFLRLNQIVPGSGMFFPGVVGKGLSYDDIRFGVLICYEGIFPEISYEYAKSGVDFLVNITNDAWYGVSSAAYQHMAFYSFRAVETRKALLRSANTGFTSFIDSSGRVYNSTKLFKRSVLIDNIPLLNERTIYSRIGDYPFRFLSIFWFYWFYLTFLKRKTIKKKA